MALTKRFEKGDDFVGEFAEQFERIDVNVRAAFISGPFSCYTQHGIVAAEDAWLVYDSEGYPYPIAADVFAKTYRKAEPGAS